MTIDIKVDGRIGRLAIPSFSITGNEVLTVVFKGLSTAKVYRHVATFLNGSKRHTATLMDDMSVTLDYSFLSGGDCVEILVESRSAKTDRVVISSNPEKNGYLIEPLKIEYVETNRTAYGWMTKLEEDIKAIKGRLGIVEKDVAEFKDIGVPLIVEHDNNTEV